MGEEGEEKEEEGPLQHQAAREAMSTTTSTTAGYKHTVGGLIACQQSHADVSDVTQQ